MADEEVHVVPDLEDVARVGLESQAAAGARAGGGVTALAAGQRELVGCVGPGVIVTDDFNKSAITGGVLISDHHTIARFSPASNAT